MSSIAPTYCGRNSADGPLADEWTAPPAAWLATADSLGLINSQNAINKGWRGRDSSMVGDWRWHSSRLRYGRQIAP